MTAKMPLPRPSSPTDAVNRLRIDDPTYVQCDLSRNAVLQTAKSLVPQLCEALACNTRCRELSLVGCQLDDSACESLSLVLRSNSTLTSLNLEENRVNNAGAQLLADALCENAGLVALNLLNQRGTQPAYGDATLAACEPTALRTYGDATLAACEPTALRT